MAQDPTFLAHIGTSDALQDHVADGHEHSVEREPSTGMHRESGSVGSGTRPPEKKRVGFVNTDDSRDLSLGCKVHHDIVPESSLEIETDLTHLAPIELGPSGSVRAQENGIQPASADDPIRAHLPQLSAEQTRKIYEVFSQTPRSAKPRSAIRRSGSALSAPPSESDSETADVDRSKAIRRARAKEAFERGRRLAEDERVRSEPVSRAPSPRYVTSSLDIHLDSVPLVDPLRTGNVTSGLVLLDSSPETNTPVQGYSPTHLGHGIDAYAALNGLRSGLATPTEEREFIEDYKPPPVSYRGGILGSLLKLYGQHSGSDKTRHSVNLPRPAHIRNNSEPDFHSGMLSAASSPPHSPASSGTATPIRGYFPSRYTNHSTSSLAHLVGSSASLGFTGTTALSEGLHARLQEHVQHGQKKSRRRMLGRMSRPRIEEEIHIKVHIAETLARQKYLLRLCRALMMYGAPTHRLEEYINMSARVLAIECQCLYIPGSMIISFDDPSTHTTEVKLVRCNQGLDLGKLRDVHEVYKEVVHDRTGVDEATLRLKEITSKKDKHSALLRVPVYGLAAASVGPFAFGARFIDLPIAFVLGCILGVLQLFVAPRSDLYANVFEIAATVITSFLARAFGSISGGSLFCFSALAQSSIALILPGYTVLCASLELQSRNLVAGSVRMVYAIIYSLFLGYGITIGSAIYGLLDHNATSAYTCTDPMQAPLYFVFVPIFTICLIIINQAKWKQAPVMVFISCVGYLVNFYSSRRFTGNTQVSNTLGALAIGVMANLYSRVGAKVENWILDLWEDKLRSRWKSFCKYSLGIDHCRKTHIKTMEEGGLARDDAASIFVRQSRRVGYGLAAAAMLPAIFVQVPSGLSVQGSLISGIASANQIAGNATNGTTVANVTNLAENSALNSTALTVGYSVIQVAIGITVGLFLSAVVVYPLGKRRSGLFSF